MTPKSALINGSFAGLCFLLIGCGQKPAETEAPPTLDVLVAKVAKADLSVTRGWVGTLDGSENAAIRARVVGYLEKRDYQEGSYVKTGDLLFEIDPRPFEAALAEAKSDLAQAQAIQLASKADFDRSQELFNKKVISVQEYENKRQLNEASVAKVSALEAAVETAQLNLGFTRITSPVDGIAGIAKAQIGDLVGTATESQLTTVSKIDPIRLYFPLSEHDYRIYADQLRKLMEVPEADRASNITLTFSDGTIYPKKGKFAFVDRQVNPTTGTILVAASFPNPDLTLRPGQYADASAAIEKLNGVLVIPEQALIELQGSYQVGVIRPDGKADIRPIKIGQRINRQVVVTEGLKDGETIIVEGAQKVRPGMVVNAKPYEQPKTDSAQSEKQTTAANPANS
ncbi:MAG: efflux RND transporter periplasmic adaptor subunit [Verrucomicrobia bacterium]|nr:efflux RND transporter periplasmic adaptor subunit [Verrucomicrobiota bacterium]